MTYGCLLGVLGWFLSDNAISSTLESYLFNRQGESGAIFAAQAYLHMRTEIPPARAGRYELHRTLRLKLTALKPAKGGHLPDREKHDAFARISIAGMLVKITEVTRESARPSSSPQCSGLSTARRLPA
jgi:hypothetical protein